MSQLRYDTEFAIVHLPVSKDQPVNWVAIADEEYANKKICSRILKHRAQPNQTFTAEEFKQTAMKSMAASGEIAAYRKNASQRLNSQQSSRKGSQQSSRQGQRPAGAGANRAEPARGSRDSSLSGDPLSEEDQMESTAAHRAATLNEKDKAELAKEAARHKVMAEKLTGERTE